VAWRAVARFEIGTSHEKQQMLCQDFGDYRILNDVIVGAVADGAGSAKHSDVGAKLAVETVVGYLSRIDKYIHKRKRCWERFSQPSKEQAKRLFAKTG
jgi:serine/threonine protein phosphatase PrpC